MVRRAEATIEWGGGEHTFALKGAQIEALEAECHNPETGKAGIGLGAIWQRVMGGGWYIGDLHNIIRLGLIGGGVGATEARRLVRSYVEGQPISPIGSAGPDCPLGLAQAIIMAAVVGVEADDTAGEPSTPEP